MDYSKMMMQLDERELARVVTAKQMILAYPYYTDEQRTAWFDALDGMMDVRKQSYLNAKEALDNAFKNK